MSVIAIEYKILFFWSIKFLETYVVTLASVHYVGDRGDIPYSSSQVFLTRSLVVSKIQN